MLRWAKNKQMLEKADLNKKQINLENSSYLETYLLTLEIQIKNCRRIMKQKDLCLLRELQRYLVNTG
jgi:hypothetical protein